MKGIKVSIILSKNIKIVNDKVSLEGILQKLSSNKRESIWMYLDVQTTLKFPNNTFIYFDLYYLDSNVYDGFELGNIILHKSMDTPNITTITDYKYRTDFMQRFQLPILKSGRWAFVVYLIDDSNGERNILETYEFDVV